MAERAARLNAPSLLDALVALVVTTSLVMVVQVTLGRFDPAWAIIWSLLVCAAAGALFVRRFAWPRPSRTLAAGIVLALVALTVRSPPFLYVEGGQDQGVYVAMSAHFARTHGLAITDRVRERLPVAERAEYDRRNNRHDPTRIEAIGRSEGEHLPGVFITDLTRSAYVFQFYPLHPLWMALGSAALGDEHRVYALVGLSLLSILMLSLLAYEIGDRRPMAAFVAAALLALDPMHAFLSRFPVSENVTLFFSAAAFYYLLRYVKLRDTEDGQGWRLALSAAAWTCAFFSHIAGFMYVPLVCLAIVLAIATAARRRQAFELFAYGVLVLVGYALSLAYGMTWAFPYSLGIYRSIFGIPAGSYFVDHWLGIVCAVGAGAGVAFALAWRLRSHLAAQWARWRLAQWLMVGTLAIAGAALAWSLIAGWRLGFTSDYGVAADPRTAGSVAFAAANENWLYSRGQLSHSGAAGFLHASAAALALYVSPFIILFALTAWAWRRRHASLAELVLVLLVAQFLVVRMIGTPLTVYYYYGRYLGAEIVPYVLVLSAIWLGRLFMDGNRMGRIAAGTTLALALAWEAGALAEQRPGGEMQRLDAGLRPVAAHVGDDDLLIISGGATPQLRTALEYYYGRQTMVVPPSELAAALERYSRLWAGVYVLSDKVDIAGLSPVGDFLLVRDTYARGGAYDVLPMGSTVQEARYYLYRAQRPAR